MNQRELIENIYKDLEDVIEESNNVNDENEESILKELALLLLYFNVSNNKLQLSNIEILKIKNKIFKIIDDIFDDEIEYIIDKMSNSLISTAHSVESYYGRKVKDDFVNSKFKNKTFKERHSQNSTEVKNKLKSTVFKFIKGGIAIGLIKNSIDKIYKIHKYNVIRLLKTEINRVQNRLFLELNKNKKFRYCSVFERNTCADCKSLDGHIFNYDEALDLIPQHSNCLCYWEVIDDKLDNNSEDKGDVTEYEKYKEILGEDGPKTLKDFQELKYNNIEEWKLTQYNYKLRNQVINEPGCILKNANKLSVDERKYTSYLFGGNNENGLAKGKAFDSRLGYGISNYTDLDKLIKDNIGKYPAIFKADTPHGKKYEVNMVLRGLKNKQAKVKVGIMHDDNGPRLTTVFIDKLKESDIKYD